MKTISYGLYSKKSFFALLLVLLLVLNCGIQFVKTQSANIQYVSSDFVKAIDAAFIEMSDDSEFIDGYRDIGLIFPIPECVNFFGVTEYPYPDKFDFNYKEKVFTMCYQENAGSPRQETHELVAKTLVRLLNKRYKINLNYVVKQLDTRKLGYFNTVKNAVDSGECQVCVASTVKETSRESEVHFQCPYESSSNGFLRSNLDPQIVVNNFKDLNKTGLIVAISAGSIYLSFVPEISAATIVTAPGTQGVLQLAAQGKAHAVLGDINDLMTFKRNSINNCTKCNVRGFGTTVEMASFTTMNIIQSSASSLVFKGFLFLIISLLCVL
ncbi:hypothetical protein ABK040_010430 [Willaertia magna]